VKKILLILCLIITLPVFAVEGLSTIEFATQTGELMGQAKICGVQTNNAYSQFIQSITILATYRKESVDNALSAYRASIQQNSGSANVNCDQVRSDFAQVEAQLQKSLKQ